MPVMTTLTFRVVLSMVRYIADPYWPEQERLITIRKQSGVDRVRSEDKRDLALSTFLKKIGMTTDEHKALEKRAKEPWYRMVRGEETSPIIIPARQMSGMLVHAAHSAPAGSRVPEDNLRSLIRTTDFVTNRKKADGVFSRYVLPKDGKGNPISNQRRFMEDEYIENFKAEGSVTFPDHMKPENVKNLVAYAINVVGVGACRKMDYGRGDLETFELS